MKKILSLLLALILVVFTFASCGQVTDNPEDTTTPTAGTTLASDETTSEPEITIAVENFANGSDPIEFMMLVRASRYHYLYVAEEDGTPVNSSVYSRNALIEKNYGIKIAITEGKGSGTEQVNFTSYLAGADSTYDLVCFDYWWNLELKGYFCNLLQLEEINPSDSWWYQGWNDNITMNGKQYSTVGDASLEVLENLEIVFFNKNMAADRNLDLYKEVDNGNWTLARMLEVSQSASANLDDGDTLNDVYGVLYDKHSVRSQLFSLGLKLSQKGSDGYFNIDNVPDDKNITLCGELTKLIQDVSVNYKDQTARARDWTYFKNSQALMYATALYQGQALRAGNLDFDYGILPMPKLDTDSDYISTPYGVSVFAIPVNVSSKHVSAMVLNALNFHSSHGEGNLVETFYDLVLKYQVANSVEDVKNLELIRDKVYVDFAFIYNIGVFDSFVTAVINNTSVTSGLTSAIKSSKKTLENNYLKFYKEN